ncbi:superoxide dismutase [Cu-Zn]-like [Lycorma delicatula]|uniref:superoxide dismutase [Cu-Zn]-like n=1 Tax=Lycorma delicatula TaxID=130591 RepID=UPI003F512953
MALSSAFVRAIFAVFLSATIASAEEKRAIAVLKGEANGNVTFVQVDDGPVTATGIVVGLTKGKHGFHIHAKGDISGGCISTQGHFNPEKKNHGGPTDEIRHVGDLGNIYAEDNGIAQIAITDKVISLSGKNSIIGRGVVVHSDQDDLGRGGFADSLTTGHAGTRVSCGVIGILHPDGYWTQAAGGANSITTYPVLTFLLLVLSSNIIYRISS